ncbi:hypothetical protein PAMP_006688 [Pampus punctatissimus]
MSEDKEKIPISLLLSLSCFPGLTPYPQCIARRFCVSRTDGCNRCLFTSQSTPQQHSRKP